MLLPVAFLTKKIGNRENQNFVAPTILPEYNAPVIEKLQQKCF